MPTHAARSSESRTANQIMPVRERSSQAMTPA